jgi:conjugative relaxase-like TrwC/TraI family protein
MHHDPKGSSAASRRGNESGRGDAVLSLSSGHSADYLTGAVAAGRESYYTGAVAAGEPPGRWYGRGAVGLGLAGDVNAQDMTALYQHFIDPRYPAFRDPGQWADAQRLGHAGRRYLTAEQLYKAALDAEPDATPERREELRLDAAKRARSNVSFIDATFSVQKSATVLHAAFEAQEVASRSAGDHKAADAWAAYRGAVEAAIWAGNNAALDYLAEHAGYTRAGHHGGSGGRFVDAHDWTIASFFQHDNRDHDPQLHIHNAVLNRVRGADGEWRTLDARSMYLHRAAAAAVGERTMEEHLTASLGVRFATRPDGKAREIVGIAPEVLDLFSSRRRAITQKTAALVREFTAFHGREPNALELDRLQRQATFATRKAKTHDGETVEQRLARWDRELRAEVAGGLATVATDVLDLAQQRPEAPAWSPTAVLETALADVQTKKAAWTQADLARAVNDALPDWLGGLDADEVTRLIDTLTAQGIARGAVPLTAPGPGADTLPDELRLANGHSVYDRPGGRVYATSGHLAAERALTDTARQAGAAAVSRELASALLAELGESGIELGADQAAAVRGVLTSGAPVEALVGPAGTGKSFVVGALAKAWQNPATWGGQSRRVVGLAASQIATQVLEGEGLTARNIARWLATQDRLASRHAAGDDLAWQLREGDLVVVDESAMASTADLTAIRQHAEAAGAKVLLTGDHRQLAAVGAAGGMRLVADTGPAYELAEVRRFTAGWERDASLRLREGDATALQEYRKHGRIIDCGTVEQAQAAAERAFLADTLAGKDTLLISDTNEQAAKLSAKVRADLVWLGRVEEIGVSLELQGTLAGVGDIVQARRNGWEFIGHDGNRRAPLNRERYRVLQVRDGGGLRVAPILGGGPNAPLGEPLTLPASYVAENVALGYASTVHSAQGLTVDTCHTVATGSTGPAALYVGMSRGRDGNIAYVAARRIPDDAPIGSIVNVEPRDPVALLTTTLEMAVEEQAALQESADSAAEAATVRTAAERFSDVADQVAVGRTATSLDRLVDEGLLTRRQREQLAADPGMMGLARVLRQAEVAGHDLHQVLADAVAHRHLEDARTIAGVLYHRVARNVSLDPQGDSYASWLPRVDNPHWRQHLEDLARVADERSRELGHHVAEQQPQWAVEALGPVPDDPQARSTWTKRAAVVAAYRELTGHDDPATALPSAPKPGQIEHTASYRAAWRALGRPEADRAEAEMTDGQLRIRVRALRREEAWQPEYVANTLSGTSQAEARHRQTAHIRAAEAAAASDEVARARLAQEAREAAALANTLARQTAQLEEADRVRSVWYAHTAATRAAADRARRELECRGIDSDQTGDETTAGEWLAVHAEAERADDVTRIVRDEEELADVAAQREPDEQVFDRPDEPAVEVQPPEPAPEPRARRAETDDWTRVATADDTAKAVARARAALAEMNRRREREERRAHDEERQAELARWHAEQIAAADVDSPSVARTPDEFGDTPTLERTGA